MGTMVLAVSDRWVADARIDALAEFARKLDHALLVLHVVYATEGSVAEKTPGERVLDQIATALRAKGNKVETLLLIADDIGAAIAKTADERRAALILVGLSSKGMLTRLIEGNAAQEIIRSARVPVLLLPGDWNAQL